MGFVSDLFGGGGGKDAANASIAASETQAAYQREALDYLKEREALPQQFREEALTQIAGALGLEGGEGSQQAFIDQARASPLYAAITGNKKAGEDAILRQQSATGGLRSGNTQHALYDYNTNLENQALLESYNQQVSGLGGLASLPSLAGSIASGTAGIGQTLGQGQVAAAQARLTGQQGGFSNLLGLGQLGVGAYSAGMFSDRRLKCNVRYMGKVRGVRWYRWDWNSKAQALGLNGSSQGVIAQQLQHTHPHLVRVHPKTGYLTVDYAQLLNPEQPDPEFESAQKQEVEYV